MPENRKILVTGSTGLVGSHLIAELIRRGYVDITLPVRDSSRLDKMYRTLEREGIDASATNFTVVETELTNPVTLKEIFRGIQTVYNCAAGVSLGAMDEKTLINGNVEIVKHIVNACLAAGVAKLVHVSSIAALGEMPERQGFIDESVLPESLAGMPSYYAGKFLSENEVWRGVATGLKAVVVNPALILGEGDWRSGSTAMVPYLTVGVPFYTEGITAMVDVRDVARAMADLADCAKAEGERFILSGGNISYKEFLTISAESSDKKPPTIKVGKFLLGITWRGAWLWGKITGKQLLFTKDLAQTLLKKTYYSTDKVEKLLGFEFTPLSDTIDRIIKNYLAEKNAQ